MLLAFLVHRFVARMERSAIRVLLLAEKSPRISRSLSSGARSRDPLAPSGLRVLHHRPCALGMSWVGAIDGAGLAGAEPVVTGAVACTSADLSAAFTSAALGPGAAACWTGAGAGRAAIGLAFGSGTERFAT